MNDEVDILPADKHQRFLQTDTVILGVCEKACPNYPNNQCAIYLQHLVKEIVKKLIFCMQISMKVSYKSIL